MKAFRILLALVWLMPLHAQIEERVLLTVNIPFAFAVENTHLPAGHYLIYAVHLDHLWELRPFRRNGSAFFGVTMDPTQPCPSRARLIFNGYDTDTCYNGSVTAPREPRRYCMSRGGNGNLRAAMLVPSSQWSTPRPDCSANKPPKCEEGIDRTFDALFAAFSMRTAIAEANRSPVPAWLLPAE